MCFFRLNLLLMVYFWRIPRRSDSYGSGGTSVKKNEADFDCLEILTITSYNVPYINDFRFLTPGNRGFEMTLLFDFKKTLLRYNAHTTNGEKSFWKASST